MRSRGQPSCGLRLSIMALPIAILCCQPGLRQVITEEGDAVLRRLLDPRQPHPRIKRAYALPLCNGHQRRQRACAALPALLRQYDASDSIHRAVLELFLGAALPNQALTLDNLH